ncbi:STN domain-containing protein [Ancylobacter polymorphus]|uniref:STN domain-containing protein n=1 Tax=Ancylobacter polymorphus TaxID=223390 RepID=A0A9E7A6Q3_9HYPH|nr:STN domain-containing protein [Ancylobacter polymorphus]UOK73888.1 STN domain-containing protein [Ancylobacter polymorphus]
MVRGKNSPGAPGRMTREEALARILSGSGLNYRVSGNAIIISDPAAAAGGSFDSDSSLLVDTIDVTSSQNPASGSGFQGTPDWAYETPQLAGHGSA